MERIQRWREQIRLCTEVSDKLTANLPDAEEKLLAASAAFLAAEQQFQRVQEEERHVALAVEIAKTAHEYLEALQVASA